jgi:hypothetical protein
LGSARILPHIQDIIKALVLSLACENRLAMNAAGFAIDDIREQLGSEVFEQVNGLHSIFLFVFNLSPNTPLPSRLSFLALYPRANGNNESKHICS